MTHNPESPRPSAGNSPPRRSAFAWPLNLIIPGTGLLLAGRVRSGVLTAFIFGAAAEFFLIGTLIAPAAVPRQLTIAAAVAAAVIWAAAQWGLRNVLRNP
jgi:hypothetical protein